MDINAAAGIIASYTNSSEGDILRDLMSINAKSQSDFAAVAINHGLRDHESLTNALTSAFPQAKIGSRHGPHFLSLARTGRLAYVTAVPIPHRRRRGNQALPTPPAPFNWQEICHPDIVELQNGMEVFGSKFAPKNAEETYAAVKAFVHTEEGEAFMDEWRAMRPNFTVDELKQLSRQALVTEAKLLGVPANGKSDAIIERIMALPSHKIVAEVSQ